MSWKKCYSGSNNLYLDHPPIMNDGRNFATLRPDEQINQDVLDENKIMSSSHRVGHEKNKNRMAETIQK